MPRPVLARLAEPIPPPDAVAPDNAVGTDSPVVGPLVGAPMRHPEPAPPDPAPEPVPPGPERPGREPPEPVRVAVAPKAPRPVPISTASTQTNPTRPGNAAPAHRKLEGTLLRRLDRVFGGMVPAGPPISAADPHGLTVDLGFDDWGPGRQPAAPGRGADTFAFLTVGFLCALTATALSMTVPNYPSFSNLMSYLPLSVPGVNTDLGVTVLSRYQPDFHQEPMREGSFILTPQASQGVSYDDNVLGYRGGPGSWISDTNASIGVNSDWSRDKVGAFVGVDHGQYFDLPKDTRTDVTAAIGGALTLGEHDLDVAYSHLSLHQDPTQIGAIQASTPVPFSVEDFRADYSYDLGALTLTPNVDFSMWRYGHAVIGGVDVDQSALNRDVVQGGIAAKYQTGELWNVLFTLAGINAHYTRPQSGVPSLDSTSFVAMGGFDYQFTGNFKARVLAGLEGREFSSSAFKSRLTPVGEADLVWTPTGLTTVTTTLARSIEDPTVSGNTGFTYTRGEIEVDHELRRDVILRARIGAGLADYLQQGASQLALYGDLGVTWLINRSLQLIVDYQLSSQTGGAPNTTPQTAAPTGHYIRNIGMARLRVSL